MERVQVEIYGQTYGLKGADEPAYIRELASFVDGKLKEVEKATGTVDPLRVAILTALTIADELRRQQSNSAERERAVYETSERLLAMTEGVRETSP